MALKFPWL